MLGLAELGFTGRGTLSFSKAFDKLANDEDPRIVASIEPGLGLDNAVEEGGMTVAAARASDDFVGEVTLDLVRVVGAAGFVNEVDGGFG